MKDLIEKFIDKQDKKLISEITNYDFDELVGEIKDWSPFNTNAKHVATDLDKKGMHLLRCLLSEKIINNIRETKFNALENKEYAELKETGALIRHNIDLNKDREWLRKIIFMFEGSDASIGFHEKTVVTSGYDIQHTAHVDTFQPSCKLWIYRNNMPLENGPFCYVKGSHKNSKEKLSLLYELSTERSQKVLYPSSYSDARTGINKAMTPEESGCSLRIKVNNSFTNFNPKDINKTLRSLNLNEETPITGETGTLCLADTSGIHRRFKGLDGSIRRSVRWCSTRRNTSPFKLHK